MYPAVRCSISASARSRLRRSACVRSARSSSMAAASAFASAAASAAPPGVPGTPPGVPGAPRFAASSSASCRLSQSRAADLRAPQRTATRASRLPTRIYERVLFWGGERLHSKPLKRVLFWGVESTLAVSGTGGPVKGSNII
eukprot:4334122-Pyramimonas_sp.AAC.1